jgi:hypothetical protein
MSTRQTRFVRQPSDQIRLAAGKITKLVPVYLPPDADQCRTTSELLTQHFKGSTPTQDWTVNVIILHAYELQNNGIVEQVNDRNLRSDGLINFLSKAMLVMDPTKRYLAHCCYDETLKLTISETCLPFSSEAVAIASRPPSSSFTP